MSLISNFGSLLRSMGKVIKFPNLEGRLRIKAFNKRIRQLERSGNIRVLGESLLGRSETLAGPNSARMVDIE